MISWAKDPTGMMNDMSNDGGVHADTVDRKVCEDASCPSPSGLFFTPNTTNACRRCRMT